MASPVAHSLMGITIYLVFDYRIETVIHWTKVALFVLIANLADFDFFIGAWGGDHNLYHHGITHTIAFALILSFIFSGYVKSRSSIVRLGKSLLVFFLLYFSHLVLDFLNKDEFLANGTGIPLFYPLSANRYFSPISLFFFTRDETSSNFLGSILIMKNVWAVLWETFFFTSVIFLVLMYKKNKEKSLGEGSRVV